MWLEEIVKAIAIERLAQPPGETLAKRRRQRTVQRAITDFHGLTLNPTFALLPTPTGCGGWREFVNRRDWSRGKTIGLVSHDVAVEQVPSVRAREHLSSFYSRLG